ncbi:MAG: tRNA (guanosine(37)-N1)-methyltransferase TrmD [Bacteriovoracaceae bacterium]|nr:tRNA (guanosine(37)-N1)-methyltransferase TrmD [Bacteriovoracaceae bacterium]
MKKKIWIITLFPDYFQGFLSQGIVGSTLRNERSTSEQEFEVNMVDLKNFSPKSFKGVDDAPFGGGAGMVMRADVMKLALMDGVVKAGNYQSLSDLHVVCPAPRGATWTNNEAKKFAADYLNFETKKDIVFICGRYEGIDERFLVTYVNQFISIGNFILTGGEIAVMTILDSSLRFVSGVLGNKLSSVDESFENSSLEYPLYTRPREFDGITVPEELLSGHHLKIEAYKTRLKAEMTKNYRPDLIGE